MYASRDGPVIWRDEDRRAGGAAGRAIDGNTSGVFAEGSVTHTNANNSLQWWEVELFDSTDIESIVVWNRTDCCPERLSDFTVFVSGSAFAADATIAELEADPLVTSFSFDGVAGESEEFQIDVTGRYVRIQKPSTSPLSLAEVQVFGVAVDFVPVDIDFNNDPVEVDLPTVDPVIPIQVDNPPIFGSTVPAGSAVPADVPDVCSASGASLGLSWPREPDEFEDRQTHAQITIPPNTTLTGVVVTELSGGRSGTGIVGSVRGTNSIGFSQSGGDPRQHPGVLAGNGTSNSVTMTLTMTDTLQFRFGDQTSASAQLTALTFVDASGNETPACPDAELNQCLANGGNFFASDNLTVLGVIYLGCLFFDSPWLNLGLTLEAVETLVATGVIELAEGVTATDTFVNLNAAFGTLGQVTLGCVNAFGDLIGSFGDIITAVLALIDDPEAFLNEQYTLIRDTVNAAVQDTNNFVDEALAGLIRLDLLQENPALWVGTIGCELLIEVLITLTGAGAAAVAAKLTEKVIDFLQARRRDLDGDGDGGGGTPTPCVLRSFSADTRVLLSNGTQIPIAGIEVGDVVFAQDPETGASGNRAVTAVWPHSDTLVDFEVGGSTVTTTEDHEFWNVTDQAWQETQHIDVGDMLLSADGEMVEAGNLLWDTAHHAAAFDLTIDGIHSYHVIAGEQSVLVHNNDDLCDGFRITPEDVQAIQDYTGGGAEEINQAIRDGSVSPDIQTRIDAIETALSQLEEFDGDTLFRGTRLPQNEVDRLLEGLDFVDDGFLSTSTDIDVIDEFIGGDGGTPTRITIEEPPLGGRVIPDELSSFPGEAEVVFPRGTEFDVVSAEIVNGDLIVVLKG